MLIREKVKQASALCAEFGVDCWLTFTRETAINGDPVLPFLVDSELTWHSALVICRDGTSHAIVGEYDRLGVHDLGAYTDVTGYVKGVKEPFQALMRRLNPSSIAVNYSRESETCDGLTHGMYLTLVDFLTEIGMEGRLQPADRIASALRQRKTPTEIAAIKKAIRHTEEIFAMVGSAAKPGMTEREVAALVTAERERRGLQAAWEPKVCPAVFSGPDTAAAHYAPTERRIEPGHILNMDFGVKVDGYCSDLQRTYYVLAPGETSAPAEVRRGFDTIVNSVQRAKAGIRPGVQGVAVDAIARTIITDAGYPEFPHGLGHQVGRFAHDGTALLGPAWEKYAGKPFYALEPGMVFTIEPRLPVPGRGIATIEEMVVVTEAGAEWLSSPQTKLITIRSS